MVQLSIVSGGMTNHEKIDCIKKNIKQHLCNINLTSLDVKELKSEIERLSEWNFIGENGPLNFLKDNKTSSSSWFSYTTAYDEIMEDIDTAYETKKAQENISYNKPITNNSVVGSHEKSQSVQEIPPKYICPITQEIMFDPWMAPSGDNFEKVAIDEWLEKSQTNPMNRDPLVTYGVMSGNILFTYAFNLGA